MKQFKDFLNGTPLNEAKRYFTVQWHGDKSMKNMAMLGYGLELDADEVYSPKTAPTDDYQDILYSTQKKGDSAAVAQEFKAELEKRGGKSVVVTEVPNAFKKTYKTWRDKAE